MSKKYAKSKPEYEVVEFDEKASLKGRKIAHGKPTSVSLSPETVIKLTQQDLSS